MTTVAACQVRIDIDDPETTWQAATTAVREAARAGAEVVVLPELTCTGSAFDSVAEAAGRAEAADRSDRRPDGPACRPSSVWC